MFTQAETPPTSFWRQCCPARRAAAFLLLLTAALLVSPSLLKAQALSAEKLSNGTELLLITRPLAELDALCFSDARAEGGARCLIAPELLFASVIEEEFSEGPAPKGVVIMAGAGQRGIVDRLRALLTNRPPAQGSMPAPAAPRSEGSVERRLVPPGAASKIELEIPLPDAADPRRSAMEVIWELLPGKLAKSSPVFALELGLPRASWNLRSTENPPNSDSPLCAWRSQGWQPIPVFGPRPSPPKLIAFRSPEWRTWRRLNRRDERS